MASVTSRIGRIEAMVIEEFTKVNTLANEAQGTTGDDAVAVVALRPEEWEASIGEDPTNLHRRFGWIPPAFVEPDGIFVFRFCPEIIDAQTRHLSDFDFEGYLEGILMLANLHLTHYQVAFEQRVQMIENSVAFIAPATMNLLSMVQMQVLDSD